MRRSITKGTTFFDLQIVHKYIFFLGEKPLFWRKIFFCGLLFSRVYFSIWMYSEIKKVILRTVNKRPNTYLFLMKTDNKSVVKYTTYYIFIVGMKNCVVVRDNISKIKSWFIIFLAPPSPEGGPRSVSYTHLTLPTIYSV